MHEARLRPAAAEVVDLALKSKPELIVHGGDLPATVEALRDLLAASDRLFDRGVPVRLAASADGSPPSAIALTRSNVVREAHRLCQPMKVNADGDCMPVTLSDRAAQMYLDMVGEWNLRPLAGISTSALLSDDGRLRFADGYDEATRLWCCFLPNVTLPDQPDRHDAEAALQLLRQTFRTFPFADAIRVFDGSLGVEVVDTSKAPGRDESAFLVALLTACSRPSLWLAPGLLITAPAISGAGSGKGLLVRAICTIAFGICPRAFTSGGNQQELEKRLAAELIEAQPSLFLDNVNGIALRSDTLASVLTERPARVRLLGQTRMVPLNSNAFIVVTGNALTVTEDLARRFLTCELDARCEDPEARPFRSGFLHEIETQRPQLLAACLTIWRFGRQNAGGLASGKPLGSFEQWADWCRDPLIALGCSDPVERIEALKLRDPHRQRVAELFCAWWNHHTDNAVKASELADAVKVIADGQDRGRQYLARFVGGLAGTHSGGFVLTRQEAAGKWGAATYALKRDVPTRTMAAEAALRAPVSPMTPMNPMPDAVEDEQPLPAGAEAHL